MNKKEHNRIVNENLSNLWFLMAALVLGVLGNIWGTFAYESVREWAFQDGINGLHYFFFQTLLVTVTLIALGIFFWLLSKKIHEETNN